MTFPEGQVASAGSRQGQCDHGEEYSFGSRVAGELGGAQPRYRGQVWPQGALDFHATFESNWPPFSDQRMLETLSFLKGRTRDVCVFFIILQSS